MEFVEVVLVKGTVGTEVSLEPMSKTNVIPKISARQAAIEKTIRWLFFLGASLAAAASAMMVSSTSESARMKFSSFFINNSFPSPAQSVIPSARRWSLSSSRILKSAVLILLSPAFSALAISSTESKKK